MAREIVVGYDGSGNAKDALRLACDLAYTDTRITVVHCYEESDPKQKQRGRQLLAEAAERLCNCTPDVDCLLVADDPAPGIARTAAERDAFLIVVGSRGLGHVKALLGSVSHRLLHDTDKPILIVPSLPRKSPEFVAGTLSSS